jgi:signal transduction histidine kinase
MRLRWAAGAAILIAAVVRTVLAEGDSDPLLQALIGAALLSVNALFIIAVRRAPVLQHNYNALLRFAAIQIHLDLLLLTALVALSGGADSPVAGFYAVHMVFAGLLLPRSRAYAAAGAAIGLLALGMGIAGQWGEGLAAPFRFLGLAAALVFTVYLSDRIARTLYRREHARVRQTRRLREITSLLRAQQAAMIQHEKMAAMGRLAAGVAHEINNPLAGMDSALQLMERNPASIRPATIKALREQVRRIHGTVRELTAFAHPDRGRIEPAPLNEVVAAALHMLEFDHRLRRVRVQTELSEFAGLAMIAPRTVQQVLMNLVINALDAMADTSEPVLSLRTRREGNWSVVEISDNGCGIRPDHLDRVFEPFFTTKPVGAGTGLGLSISASLVSELRGEISVTSHPGAGAMFTLRLPAADRLAAQIS